VTEHEDDRAVEQPVEPAASGELPVEPAASGELPAEPAAVEDPLARLRQRAARHAPGGPGSEAAEPAAAAAPVELAAVSAPTDAVAGPTGRRGLRGVSRTAAVLAGLAVLAAALTAVAAAATVKFAGNHTTTGASTSGGRAAIIAAAVSGVTATASYDWRTLDADERAAESQLAEPFRTSYAQRFQAQVAPLARKYHATAKASVDPKFGAGLVSVTGGHANVLLYVDQVVTNKQLSAPRLDQTRVFATLQQVDGKWRIAGLRTI